MMQTQATFYVMPEESADNAFLHFACLQAAKHYRQQERIFIFTPDLQTAHTIDELLWAFDADSFVPHNLQGEGPRQGAAVEISWQAPRNRRAILINLTSTVPNFANQFSHIVDFVPANDALKQQARDRFRACRQWGFNTESHTINSADLQLNTNSQPITE